MKLIMYTFLLSLTSAIGIGRDSDCHNATKNCEYTLKCDGPLY